MAGMKKIFYGSAAARRPCIFSAHFFRMVYVAQTRTAAPMLLQIRDDVLLLLPE
jgi:hypothetical protein